MTRGSVLTLLARLAPALAAAEPASQPATTRPAAGAPLGEMERETFAGAITRALARNPGVVVALEEIRRADAVMREVRAQSIPTVFGSITYTRLDADRTLAQPPPTPARVLSAANQMLAIGTINVPLIQPKSWALWAHAKENIDVARVSAADVKRQTALATARAYLTVFASKRVLEVNVSARETARAHYEFSHARRAGGVGNRIDEVRAAQELATDVAQVEAAEAAVTRAREALGVLLGTERPVDTADEPVLPLAPSMAAALDETEAQRTDVRAARAKLRAADNVYHDTWADFSPSLIVTWQPFSQYPAALTMPVLGWQGMLTLNIPFYDGGLALGLRRERAVLRVEARVQLEATVRQARSDVRAAYEAARRADAALVASKDAARLSKDALALAILAYRAGATTNIEVIDAERRARDAETAAAIAEDSARQARIDLLASSGRFP